MSKLHLPIGWGWNYDNYIRSPHNTSVSPQKCSLQGKAHLKLAHSVVRKWPRAQNSPQFVKLIFLPRMQYNQHCVEDSVAHSSHTCWVLKRKKKSLMVRSPGSAGSLTLKSLKSRKCHIAPFTVGSKETYGQLCFGACVFL